MPGQYNKNILEISQSLDLRSCGTQPYRHQITRVVYQPHVISVRTHQSRYFQWAPTTSINQFDQPLLAYGANPRASGPHVSSKVSNRTKLEERERKKYNKVVLFFKLFFCREVTDTCQLRRR